jgi:hypothetical protein
MALAIPKLTKAEFLFTGFRPKAEEVVYKILATTHCK